MKLKKLFSFDELKDAEEVLANGFEKGIDIEKMYTVAKYFRSKLGYGEIRLERELIKFCKEQDNNFNPVIEAGIIKKWVRSAMNYGLRKIDAVSISKKDVEFLSTIENQRDRKILFVTLVFSKILKQGSTKLKNTRKKTDNYYIHYSNFMDIIHLANLHNFREIELAKVYHKYLNLFTVLSPESELIRLEYLDKYPTEEIIISDLKNLDIAYNFLFGGNAVCPTCNKIFIRKANNQKICPDCSKEKRRDSQKILMRKKRNSVTC